MRTIEISDGRVNLTVSELCLGTMYFGYRTDEATAFAILDRFREAGGTFLDTANNYGQWHGDAGESERVIGRWLRSRGAAGAMVVATKVGARTSVPGDPDPRHWQGLGAKAIAEDAETSLRNLGTGRLDLYYAHIDDRATPLEETVDALATLAESGKAGLLGVSNTATWRIERARGLANGRPSYSCVQQQYTYLLAQPAPGQLNLVTEELLDYAAAEGMTVLAYTPLQSGYYARPGTRPHRAYDHAGNTERMAALRAVADRVGATANQVVLAWLLRHGIIPIPGASSVAQLDEIIGATSLTLDDADLDQLDGAGRPD
ncbi:MAG TPA: aldo/keto reductase [Streptosporangiaceae bacterium]|nr:aldo/keto reductase [Streptosporangiaceae bacterium]